MNREKFQPGPSNLVLADLDPDKFRAHEWRRILNRRAWHIARSRTCAIRLRASC
jgi:hypothetical protein